jgi:hypothetical protein
MCVERSAKEFVGGDRQVVDADAGSHAGATPGACIQNGTSTSSASRR